MSESVKDDTTRLRLGFGGSGIGSAHRAVDAGEAAAAVDAAWERGIRYFDTAPFYGLGVGEERLGAGLAGRPRDEFVISTKVGRLIVDGRVEHDYSRDGVRRSLEASHNRTGLDRFDIVLVHDAEDHLAIAVDEALPALCELRDEGAIAAVGVGMNVVAPIEQMLRRTDLDVVMLAGRWTLIDRTGGGLLDECGRRGIEVLAAAPYNSGLLADLIPQAGATFDYLPVPADLLARARACAAICERHGVDLPTAALQFPLRHPAVARVVVGLCSAAEVHAAVERATAPIPDAVWHELDA